MPGIKELDQDFQASFHNQTMKMSYLLYRMNKTHLRDFICDPVNVFLIQYFHENNGLEITDPNGDKPRCRGDTL